MKLLRYGPKGQEKPGLLDGEGRIRDLQGVVPDIAGETLCGDGLDRLRALDPESLPLVDGHPRLGPCVGSVGKFIAIGLNYSDHAAETGLPIPAEPVIFMKAASCISGPNDPVVIPPGSTKLDWEVELGIVIGKAGANIAADAWQDHVAGYCVVNDVSERSFQIDGTGQWVKGKSADSFGPAGPWLVTRDAVPDPQNLALWLEVDGKRYQDGHTGTMIFSVSHLVPYVSRFMSLQPGDIITTGTPPGVGLGQEPPVFLKAGQRMRLGVEGLGEQEQEVVAHA